MIYFTSVLTPSNGPQNRKRHKLEKVYCFVQLLNQHKGSCNHFSGTFLVSFREGAEGHLKFIVFFRLCEWLFSVSYY